MLIQLLTRLFKDTPYSATVGKKWLTGVRVDITDADHPDKPYMRRFILLRTPLGACYLHLFFRSDNDRGLHDHPWPFTSFIVSGGYWEQTPLVVKRVINDLGEKGTQEHAQPLIPDDPWGEVRDAMRKHPRARFYWSDKKPEYLYTWYGPGTLRSVPALWLHRVVLASSGTGDPLDAHLDYSEPAQAVTLVFTGNKKREWGFIHPIVGWIHNRRYHEFWGASNLSE